jgi:hypothetical protein
LGGAARGETRWGGRGREIQAEVATAMRKRKKRHAERIKRGKGWGEPKKEEGKREAEGK